MVPCCNIHFFLKTMLHKGILPSQNWQNIKVLVNQSIKEIPKYNGRNLKNTTFIHKCLLQGDKVKRCKNWTNNFNHIFFRKNLALNIFFYPFLSSVQGSSFLAQEEMFLFKNIVQSEPENYSLEKTGEIMTLNSLINMGHSNCAV